MKTRRKFLRISIFLLLAVCLGGLSLRVSSAAGLVQSGIVFINSVFASGSGGTTLTSSKYQMQGVIGEAGLPNNATVLTSAHYRYNPGFLAYAGIVTANYSSVGSYDGWVLESTETSGKGGTMSSTSTLLYVGDNAQKKQYRGILSFNTASLPDTAVITSVTLKLKLQGTIGTSPFTTHGNLLVDIRKGPFGGANALQLGDFQATASKNSIGTIPKTPVSGWYTKSFSSTAFTYINKTGVTQFRLRFTKDDDNDAIADYLKFYSGNAGASSYRPQLIIEYYTP